MSERRRSAAALSSRAHAFSVEALIGSNKKRKLRGWEEKELELSMESLATDGEDPAHCLDMDPGQCAHTHTHTHICIYIYIYIAYIISLKKTNTAKSSRQVSLRRGSTPMDPRLPTQSAYAPQSNPEKCIRSSAAAFQQKHRRETQLLQFI
uniref:Uncharacterized protein n=1 Tax=Xiphophorus couchianus TaxID=32473 RepID=A0A3B5LME4_9TELE